MNTLTSHLLITAPLLALHLSHIQKPADPVVHSIVVNAPVSTVWKAYTTGEGMQSWMAASASVDLRVGGLIRTSYEKTDDLNAGGAIHNRILSFDPERMISIQCVRTPEKFPFKSAIARAWTNLYFESVGENKTKVTSRMLGFDDSAESVQCRNFFVQGNQIEMDELAKKFGKAK
jgi:uncharacterized protein YndB with AHSA1/START domain